MHRQKPGDALYHHPGHALHAFDIIGIAVDLAEVLDEPQLGVGCAGYGAEY
jgi:hypothetical protein